MRYWLVIFHIEDLDKDLTAWLEQSDAFYIFRNSSCRIPVIQIDLLDIKSGECYWIVF